MHLWSGDVFSSEQAGGRFTVTAPLGEPGVFYAEGSAVAEQFLASLRAEGVLD